MTGAAIAAPAIHAPLPPRRRPRHMRIFLVAAALLLASVDSIALRSRTPTARRAESYLRFVAAQKSF